MILEFSLVSMLSFTAADKLQFFQGNFEESQEIASGQKKPIFIDFYTDWCGWCKTLDQTTFVNESVVALMNQSYVNLKVDAEKGEGPSLAKRYGVTGFPTLLFVDAQGEEIDRIIGYLAPEPFLETIRDFQSGNSFQQLQRDLLKSPNDSKIQFHLGKKWKDRGETEKAKELFLKITGSDLESKQELTIHSHRELAIIELEENEKANPLIEFAQKYPDPKFALAAHKKLVRIYQANENTEAAEASFEYIIQNDKPSPEWYDGYANLLIDANHKPQRALEIANKLVELAPKEARAHATLAEALVVNKQKEKAVASLTKAIELAAKNARYKKTLDERLKEVQEGK